MSKILKTSPIKVAKWTQLVTTNNIRYKIAKEKYKRYPLTQNMELRKQN